MKRARHENWTNLWKFFWAINKRGIVPKEKLEMLRQLLGMLRQENYGAKWQAIEAKFESMHKFATSKQWDELYGLLNQVWQAERQGSATAEELAAYAGARKRFLL